MNIIEKRDYIHNHLSQADEKIIDEIFEKLRSVLEKNNQLKDKLTTRAMNSEKDIKEGRLFTREEVEKKLSTKNISGQVQEN